MINTLVSQELANALFFGTISSMPREVYYDILSKDALMYVQGYFTSVVNGNQEEENRRLVYRISSNQPRDKIDIKQHFLMPKIKINRFLDVFLLKTKNIAPFPLIVNGFRNGISGDEYFTENTLQEFQDFYFDFISGKASPDKAEMAFSILFNESVKTLVSNWIETLKET